MQTSQSSQVRLLNFDVNIVLDDLAKCLELWRSSTFWTFKNQVPGFTPLAETLREQLLCRKHRLCVAVEISKYLHKLHALKITQEDLTINDIFIKKSNQVPGFFKFT